MIGPASVPGSIYRVQRYPAYKQEPAGEVHGELYRLSDPATTLNALDEYEGEDFERVVVREAWIYRYKPVPPMYSRISSGDFCAK